ncbi:MAG: pilus assembly protein, partial [Anaerolineales bacterium]|nr:pilus assembly protein [Anaerolineales bacterium]
MAPNKVIKRRNERGQSLVETALLLPILLLIIAGLVEISNLIIAQSKTDTAARIGARFGANGGEPDGIRIAALNSL